MRFDEEPAAIVRERRLGSSGQVEDCAGRPGKAQESRDPDGADQEPDRQISPFALRRKVRLPRFQRRFRLTQRGRSNFDLCYGASQRVRSTGAGGAIERATAFPPFRMRPTAKVSIDARPVPMSRSAVSRAPPSPDTV